jgi:hypothetical protein
VELLTVPGSFAAALKRRALLAALLRRVALYDFEVAAVPV